MQSVRGITVEIGGDSSKLGKALEESEKKSRDLQKELRNVNTALKFNPGNVELLTQKQQLLTEQIAATSEKLDTLRAAQEQVEQQFQNGEIGAAQYREFQRLLVETESQLKTYQSQLAETGRQSTALEGLTRTISDQEKEVARLKEEYKNAVLQYGENSQEAQELAGEIRDLSGELRDNRQAMEDLDNSADELDQSLEDVGEAAEKSGDGFTLLEGIIANLAAEAISAAVSSLKDLASQVMEVGINFENSMANNAALFGASGDELAKLEEAAMHYGATTQFSASQVADAFGYMALAGWDVDQAVSNVDGVLNLAAASGMGLAEASDMVTDYLSAFSGSAMTAAEFANMLAYSQANSNTTAAQLGEAYKNCAANLNASGQSARTTTAALAMMANQGLKGSEAGTALTAVMRDMTAKMEDGKIAIGDTSVAVADSEGNYRDLLDIVADVERAVDGLGETERATALSATFTADSIKSMNLILNSGVSEAKNFATELGNIPTEFALNMGATMTDTVSGAMGLLQSNVESKMIGVFNTAKDSIKDSINSISEALDKLPWDKIGNAVGKMAENVASAIGWIAENFDTLSIAADTLAKMIGIIFVTTQVTKFKTAIEGLGGAFGALFTVVANHPFAAVLVAATAVYGVVSAMVEKRQEEIEKVWGLTEDQKALTQEIHAMAEEYKNAQVERDGQSAAIQSQTEYIRLQWEKLQKITDETGKIKAGHEAEAEAIATIINDEHLGMEIKIVDGLITGYQDLSANFGTYLELKRAELILEAQKDAYVDAYAKQAEALQKYNEALSLQKERQETLNEATSQYEEFLRKYPDFVDVCVSQSELEAKYTASERMEFSRLNSAVNAARSALEEADSAVEESLGTYTGYNQTIREYDGLMAAVASGDAEAIREASQNIVYHFQTADTATKESLKAQADSLRATLASMKEIAASGSGAISQAQIAEMEQLVKRADTEYAKAQKNAVKAVHDASEAVNDAVTAAGSMVVEPVEEITEEVKETLDISEETADIGSDVASSYGMSIDAAGNMIIAGAGAIADGVTSELDIASATYEKGAAAGQGYSGGLSSQSGVVRATGDLLATIVGDELDDVNTNYIGSQKGADYANGISSKSGSAYSAGSSVASNARSGADGVAMYGTGASKGQELVNGVSGQSSSAYSAGYSVASSARNGASAVQSLYGTGQNLIQGLINGIGSMAGSLWSAAANAASNAISAIKSKLGIASPSKVAYELGSFFSEGFTNAITDWTGQVGAAAGNMANAAAEALKGDAFDSSWMSDPVYSVGLDSGVNGLTLQRQIESTFAGTTSGSTTSLTDVIAKLDQVTAAITQHKSSIVLDTGVLVGETVSQIDRSLGDIYELKERGVAV